MIKQQNMTKKAIAIAMAFLLCFSVTFLYGNFAYAKEGNTVRISVGVAALHIMLTVDGKEFESVTNDNGEAEFTELYEYLAETLRWDPSPIDSSKEEEASGENSGAVKDPGDPAPPDITEVKVTYDINYQQVPVWEKNNKPNGNARYAGKKGSFKLTLNEPTDDLSNEPVGEPTDPPDVIEDEETSYQWQQTIQIDAPAGVDFVKGTVKVYGYEETENQAKPVKGIQIYTLGDSGETASTTSNHDGSFEFYPQATPEGREDEVISIPETEEYYGCEIPYKEFIEAGSSLSIKSKFIATEGVDFDYGKNIINGYVSAPGIYELHAAEGRKLSLSLKDSFEENLQVEVNETGTCPDIYVQNEKGDVSRPVSGVIGLDHTGPVIAGVDSVGETEGEEITFTSFGIFTNTTADLTIEITVTDEGCGVEKLYMIGKNTDNSEVKYDALSNLKGDGKMTSTFDVKSEEELLKQELSIVAVDYLGNESSFRLIRGEVDSSTITIEKNAPDMTDIAIKGNPSSYGWYSNDVSFSFSTQDFESGLKSVTASINGKIMVSEKFGFKENEQKDYQFTLTKALIAELEGADGNYNVTVNIKDNCNNVSTKSVNVLADIVAPVVSITGVNQQIYQTPPIVHIINNEKYADRQGAALYVSIYRSGTLVSNLTYNGASSATIQNECAADGMYQIMAYAVDAAGNRSNSAEVSFTVDATAPVITPGGVIDALPSEYGWYNKPLTYAFTAEDKISGIDLISVTINGTPIAYENGVIHITQEVIENTINDEGTYLIEITVTDKAGNIATYNEVLRIDLVTPELTLNGIDKGRHYRKTPTLIIKNDEKHYAENGAYIQIKIERDGKKILNEKKESQNRIVYNDFKIDGDYIVTIMAEDAAGNKAQTKVISFVKDTTRPVIKITGAEKGKYYDAGRKINITVDERYYKSNKVKVEITRKLDGVTRTVSFPWKNKKKVSVNTKMLDATGTYKIKVSAVDEAGNAARSMKLDFTVDTIAPKVEITGVQDKIYTYDDAVVPVISFFDNYYDSKEVTLIRAGTQWYGNLSKSEGTNRISFANFAKKRTNDGVYHLKVTVKDKSGNATTKTQDFAVNRFGSTFAYNNELKKLDGKYVKNVTNNLIVTEKNISQLESSTNEIKRDGDVVSGNVTTSYQGRAEGYNIYDHIFGAENFKDEGVYQVNVISKDKAGNKMESHEYAGAVKFYVDRTAPVISSMGMSETYIKDKVHTITASASDNLSAVKLSVLINGEEAQFVKNKDTISFTLDEGLSQDVSIIAIDAAGNKEVQKKTITVTTNALIYVVLKYRLILGIAAAFLIATITLFIAKKKKKTDPVEK